MLLCENKCVLKNSGYFFKLRGLGSLKATNEKPVTFKKIIEHLERMAPGFLLIYQLLQFVSVRGKDFMWLVFILEGRPVGGW